MTHLSDVRSMPCILCEILGMEQKSPTEAHHPRTGEGKGQKAHDALAIPLCASRCHRGPSGVHGDKTLLRLAKVTEMDLVGMVVERRLGNPNAPRGTSPKRQSKPIPQRVKQAERPAYAAPSKSLPHPGYSR